MKTNHFYLVGLLFLSACGGAGGTATASSENSPVVSSVGSGELNDHLACVTSLVTENFDAASQDTDLGGMSVLASKAAALSGTCVFRDASGQTIAGNWVDLQPVVASVTSMLCDYPCLGMGRFTTETTSAEGVPIFTNQALGDEMNVETIYDGCEMVNTCANSDALGELFTLDGAFTVTARRISSVPCDAELDIVSAGLTIDGAAPASTFNLVLHITHDGSCGDAPEAVCENVLDESSTLFDGTTTYDKNAICDLEDLCE
jgi:hypothetical protein